MDFQGQNNDDITGPLVVSNIGHITLILDATKRFGEGYSVVWIDGDNEADVAVVNFPTIEGAKLAYELAIPRAINVSAVN